MRDGMDLDGELEEHADMLEAPDEGGVRIGMWGAAAGGKTTYLAALRVAVVRSGEGDAGTWRIAGVRAADNDVLIRLWSSIVEKRQFPDKTLHSASYSWRLSGDVKRRWWGQRHVQFMLRFRDVPGEEFEPESPGARAMLRHMREANGLIYVFDPTRDTKDADKHNLDYFQGVVTNLLTELSGSLVRGRLPHRVAVCVTKFDDPEIFALAMREGWVSQGLNGSPMPKVADEDAKLLFDRLCELDPRSDASLLRGYLNSAFLPERVKYFVTSSVGFYVQEDGEFDERDFSNIGWADGKPYIRSAVRPINVLEPLLWLEHAIRTGKR